MLNKQNKAKKTPQVWPFQGSVHQMTPAIWIHIQVKRKYRVLWLLMEGNTFKW